MAEVETTRPGDGDRGAPLLSIVIPAHNEGEGIASALQEIERVVAGCSVTHEIIVVDDGSRDGTYERVRAIAATGLPVKAIRFSRNFGKESALLAGLKAAAGQAVVTMDADLQHPPSLVPIMLERWRTGAKVVHAVKRERTHDAAITRWRAALFNGLLTKLGGIDVRNASDFKLLDRVAVDAIVVRLPERRRFYRGLADWVGFEQASVPFDVGVRDAGEGKWSLRSLFDLATTAIVSFTAAPLRIVTVLGLLTLGFALLVAADTVRSRLAGSSVSGFATLEITLLLLGSFIMISLGIVGEYIAKIYDEIKARPHFIVADSSGFEGSEPSAGAQRAHDVHTAPEGE
jgi:glycosyltransferase involved in cell wall biosynthesis